MPPATLHVHLSAHALWHTNTPMPDTPAGGDPAEPGQTRLDNLGGLAGPAGGGRTVSPSSAEGGTAER